MNQLKTTIVVLLLAATSFAVDQKSLLLGVGIGLGVYTAQHGVAPTAKTLARTSKRAVKASARGCRKAIAGK